MTLTASARPGGLGVLRTWMRAARQRMHERPFWIIQAGVLAVMLLHTGVEASGLSGHSVLGGIGDLPVVLHLLPVAYAGYSYGYEGSLLTGAWTAILSIPNLILWHGAHYAWVGELLFIAFVMGLGVVVAIPVERERLQRERAERASRHARAAGARLAVLNGVAAALVDTAVPMRALEAALDGLVEGLALRSASVVPAAGGANVRVVRIDRGEIQAGNLAGDGAVAVPIQVDGQRWGTLVAVGAAGGTLEQDDREVVASAARHIGVALDNIRLHQAEQGRLRSYVQEVTRAQERERARIARDLHDLVAQDLVVLTRQLDGLEDAHAREEMLAQVRDLAGTTLDAVRRVSRDLRPTVLDDLGLEPALRWFAEQVGERSHVAVDVVCDGRPRRLSAETELALYRIAQEALRNAERHAAPERVEVALRFSADALVLSVSDDGRGFDTGALPDALVREGRLGLVGMRERAELVGAGFEVEAEPGRGTRVTVTLAAPDEAASAPSA